MANFARFVACFFSSVRRRACLIIRKFPRFSFASVSNVNSMQITQTNQKFTYKSFIWSMLLVDLACGFWLQSQFRSIYLVFGARMTIAFALSKQKPFTGLLCSHFVSFALAFSDIVPNVGPCHCMHCNFNFHECVARCTLCAYTLCTSNSANLRYEFFSLILWLLCSIQIFILHKIIPCETQTNAETTPFIVREQARTRIVC